MALDMLHLVVGKTRTDKSIICATNFEGIETAKLRAGVVTVFDLRKLGESLASFEFTDS
jgi:hypothetical protein